VLHRVELAVGSAADPGVVGPTDAETVLDAWKGARVGKVTEETKFVRINTWASDFSLDKWGFTRSRWSSESAANPWVIGRTDAILKTIRKRVGNETAVL
jgi:hypothetical protein